MTNYIEDRLQQLMSEDTPFVRVSAADLENDKWDDEGGADVSICIRQPWLWHVLGTLRGPYYYLRDHGGMVPEIAFHINEPNLLTDGAHMGYQRCDDVVYYRGDNVDDILRDLAADVEDLARNTMKKHGDGAS
jgi:hypothetical protein|nr:MAG TPA: hypothetical protein [Caudoviricetes sp.]